MKSKELKRYNLPEDRILLALIDAKPNATIAVLALIGFILVMLKQYTWGVSLILFSFLLGGFLPRRILIEFYNEYLVLFNHANRNDCEIIYYEDVVKWRYVSGLSYDTLSISLVDDSVHTIDGFSKIAFETQMNRFLKDKKEKVKKHKKLDIKA